MMRMSATGLAFSICALMLLGAIESQAAADFYVSVTGSIQGPFKGELQGKGLDGKFAGIKFDYEVVVPRDSSTGLITQRPKQHPVRIQKAWGPASLQFYAAMSKNELLAVTIDFVTQDPSGQTVLDRTVKLTGALVASFVSHSEQGPAPASDVIELVFQKIELIDHKLKAAVSAPWLAPQ